MQTPKILIVSADRSLANEVDEALASVNDVNAVTHTVTDYRQGIESARSRRPDLALVEMGRDQRYLKMFVEEVAVGSPETAVVAVFHPSAFSDQGSESDVIISALRLGVQDFLRRPISSADLNQFIDRLSTRSSGRSSRAGTVSTFFSNKGGVGKSTLSVNVGCALAKRYPGRVLVVDASLQLGVCASLLNVSPTTTLIDAVRERDRLDETLIRELSTPHPSGLHLLAAPADAVEATMVDDEIISRVLTLARRSYDYVVVDTFPMLDSVMMAILDLTDTAFLVTESVVPTLLGAAKLLKTLDQIGVASGYRRVVLNRYSDFQGNLKPQDVARRLGQEVAHVIPYQKRLLVHANLGEPMILSAGRMSKFAQRVYKIVDDIAATTPSARAAGSATITGQSGHSVGGLSGSLGSMTGGNR